MEIRFAQTQKPDYQIQYSRIFRKNDDTTYIVIEKAIFYSAFIIRKLIDCDGNLSDEAENYSLEALAVQPFKLVDFLHRKSVCNWLIHSYMFFVVFNEDNVIYSFSVTSDFDRNKILYGIPLEAWITYMDYVALDDVAGMLSRYDPKANDYAFSRKERGKR